MKNYFCIAVLIYVSVCSTYAQVINPPCQPGEGFVYTPKCTEVPVTATGSAYTTQQQDAIGAVIKNQYPQAKIIGPADPRYNCHGYAWHMTGKDNNVDNLLPPVWIDFPGNFLYTDLPPPTPLNTPGDGSYVQVPCEALAQKVLYTQFDHSAITTNVPGKFISKWDSDPLMEHSYNYLKYAPLNTPNINYTNGSMKFFRYAALVQPLPQLDNSPIICQSSKVFTTSYPNSNAVITWNVSPSHAVTQPSGTGNSFTLTLDDDFTSGTLTLTITATACGVQLANRSATISVYNTKPPAPSPVQILNQNGFNLCPNTSYTIFLQDAAFYENSYAVTDYEWQLTGGVILSGQYTRQIKAQFNGSPGSVYIKMRSKNCKGWSPWKNITATLYASTNTLYCSSSFLQSSGFLQSNNFLQATVSPNPAQDYVNINLIDPEDKKRMYKVELLNQFGVPVKRIQNSNPLMKMITSDLSEGIYYLIIRYDDAMIERRVIIKR